MTKGSENIWPRQKTAGRRVENKDPTKRKILLYFEERQYYNGATLHACDMIIIYKSIKTIKFRGKKQGNAGYSFVLASYSWSLFMILFFNTVSFV